MVHMTFDMPEEALAALRTDRRKLHAGVAFSRRC